jgi:hypothetical protein
MSDSPPDPYPFEPVPSASTRHDGWTPERQRLFILVLSKIGVVAFAARAVGMSRKSAYALLKRAGPESSFAWAFAEARTAGRTNAWFKAVGRAIEGEEMPYFYRGIQRGTRRVYDNRLLIAAFRAIERAQGGDGGWRGEE